MVWLGINCRPGISTLSFFNDSASLALIDLSAAVVNVLRDGKQVDFKEIRHLIPLIIIGSLVGATILLTTSTWFALFF